MCIKVLTYLLTHIAFVHAVLTMHARERITGDQRSRAQHLWMISARTDSARRRWIWISIDLCCDFVCKPIYHTSVVITGHQLASRLAVDQCNRSNFLSCISKRYLKHHQESLQWCRHEQILPYVVDDDRVPRATLDGGSQPYSTTDDAAAVMNLLCSVVFCSRFCLRRHTLNCRRLHRKMFTCFTNPFHHRDSSSLRTAFAV